MARAPTAKLTAPLHELEAGAHRLAARMPELLVESRRVAHTVTHGIHGRRRAGPGETFWQFRHFENSDSATSVDWRRSASSEHLYVREREWEAAHTVWLWADISASMHFQSHLSRLAKVERVIVLALSVAELLVRGGERVGLIGGPPSNNRNAVRKLAEAVTKQIADQAEDVSLPPEASLGRFSECLMFSDFLEPVDAIAARLERLATQGVRGHLVQILDPAEETLPYEGRTEFAASEGDVRMIAGRAEFLRERYQARIAEHRQALNDMVRRLEWSFLVHHTDRPAEEALLALHTRLAGLEHDYRYRPPADAAGTAAAEGPAGP
ncbi:MAG: DUF58 domain-containing protein [Hyphomicrobiales bacterium]|nr:DUF58 domain-containing protein [Hyphomicrobiales bacterium]